MFETSETNPVRKRLPEGEATQGSRKPDSQRRKTVRGLRVFQGIVGVLSWIYVLLLAGVWAVHWAEADRWWVATLLVYGPKYVWAVPLGLLLPMALIGRRKSLGILLIASIMLAFPIMDLRVPWKRLSLATSTGPSIRLLTLNTHEGALDATGLRLYLGETNPQIVVLEELVPSLRSTIFADGTWHLVQNEQYCIASRFPVRSTGVIFHPPHPMNSYASRYEVDTPDGTFPLVIVHLGSPHKAFAMTLRQDPKGPAAIQENSVARFNEARDVHRIAANSGPGVVLAGDFNLPTDSRTYQSEFSSLKNAFDDAGWGFGWSYEVRLTITRIDHILTGSAWQARRCWVGPLLGSPHHPVLADLEWIGGPMADAMAAASVKPSVPLIAVKTTAVAIKPASSPTVATTVPVSSTRVTSIATMQLASTTGPTSAPATPLTTLTATPPVPAVRPIDPAIMLALRDHHLVVGMTFQQASTALSEWDGPTEVPATLHSGWKLYRWKKGEERLGAAFDADGVLRSFQRI